MLLQTARSVLDSVNKRSGRRSLVLVSKNKDINEAYDFRFLDESCLKIRCHEYIYLSKHEAWWMPNKTIRIYRVFAEFENATTNAFEKRLEEGIYLSALLPFFASRVQQKKAAIQAFTSLALHEFESQPC